MRPVGSWEKCGCVGVGSAGVSEGVASGGVGMGD